MKRCKYFVVRTFFVNITLTGLLHALLLTDPTQPALQANMGIDKHSQFIYIKPVKTKGPDTPVSSALLEKDGKFLVYAVHFGVSNYDFQQASHVMVICSWYNS